MKQPLYRLSYLRNLFLAIPLCAVTSCDKLEDVAKQGEGLLEKAKEMKDSLTGDGEIVISDEELIRSDEAYGKCLEILEKVPDVLITVRNENTAIAAREKLDELSAEVAPLLPDLVVIQTGEGSGESHHLTEVSYHILKENEAEYATRRDKAARRILFQLERVKKVTADSPIAVDLLINGLAGLSTGKLEGSQTFEGIAIDDKGSRNVPTGISGAEEKSWLPPGVVRGNPDAIKKK